MHSFSCSGSLSRCSIVRRIMKISLSAGSNITLSQRHFGGSGSEARSHWHISLSPTQSLKGNYFPSISPRHIQPQMTMAYHFHSHEKNRKRVIDGMSLHTLKLQCQVEMLVCINRESQKKPPVIPYKIAQYAEKGK